MSEISKQMENTEKLTIGEMVAKDYRTASIFESLGMDFCCGGGKTIDQVCSEKDINKEEVFLRIEALDEVNPDQVDYSNWELDKLIEHIQIRHHSYVEEKMPIILSFLQKLSSVHGQRHPELHEVRELFESGTEALAVHMKKEELILFPYVLKMVNLKREGKSVEVPHFNSVKNPIKSMENDHDNEGERFRRISKLTDNYWVPEDGCNTYLVTMKMLKEFEEELHMHIHLENNILFPGAQALEDEIRNVDVNPAHSNS